jgi:triosephosphate isomerase
MNGSIDLLITMITNLESNQVLNTVDVVLCPPSIFLQKAVELTKNTQIKIGAQNCYFSDNGAYTGEISTSMLKQSGVEYVIIGHSERRELFLESDTDVIKKILSAEKYGLVPIVCIGESLEARENQQTFSVLDKQLEMVAAQADLSNPSRIVVAYEPIWAIGTGKTASPAEAEQVHSYIRAKLGQIRIVYGGSLKPENAEALFNEKSIAGGLVGGASLQVKDFISICERAKSSFSRKVK